jgi:hypothetical protein
MIQRWGTSGWWHSAKILLIATVIAAVLAFVGAICGSRYYWGYFLSPPDFDARVRDAKEVTTFTFFMKDADVKDAFHDLQDWSTEDIQAAATQPAEEISSHSVSFTRAGVHLARSGVLKRSPTTLPAAEAAKVFQLVRDTGKLEVEGLAGSMMEFTNRAGERMLFVAAAGEPGIGGAVSNDHYPFYEFLFDRTDGEAKLLSFRKFYYDIAGIEGFEWPQMFLFFGMILFVAIDVPVAIYLLVRRWIERRRLHLRGFPLEVTARED